MTIVKIATYIVNIVNAYAISLICLPGRIILLNDAIVVAYRIPSCKEHVADNDDYDALSYLQFAQLFECGFDFKSGKTEIRLENSRETRSTPVVGN